MRRARLLPENTLPAFAGPSIGVDTLELDVGVTKAAVVVHHDRGLNPDIARSPTASGSRRKPHLTFAGLQRYDVGRLRPGSEHAKRFPHQKPVDGTRIPRLADLFLLVKDKHNSTVRFNIEPKSDLEAPQDTLPPEPFAKALLAEIRKAGLERRTTLQAFDWRSLKVVEREAPEMQTVYCTEGENSDPAKVHAAGGRIWSPNFAELSERKLAEARKLKMKVTVWTVNEPADIARMIDAGVDGMASDYPDRVIGLLKQRGKR